MWFLNLIMIFRDKGTTKGSKFDSEFNWYVIFVDDACNCWIRRGVLGRDVKYL